VMAGLPTLFGRERVASATGLYGTLTELGYTVGPAIAGLLLLLMSPSTLLLVNGVTFAISGAIIATVPLRSGAATASRGRDQQPPRSLLAEAKQGVALTARMPLVRTVILATSATLLFGGMVNVSELLLVRDLGAGDVGYSILVTVSGLGIMAGTVASSRAGSVRVMRGRFIAGLATFGGGLIATGVAPSLPVALAGIALAGIGNGMVITHERLLIQLTVDNAVMGRVFGIQSGLDGAAFGLSFLAGGAVLSLIAPATLFVVAGAGGVFVWLAARALLPRRGERVEEEEPESPNVAARSRA
jgi:Major Facilitator Superfamily